MLDQRLGLIENIPRRIGDGIRVALDDSAGNLIINQGPAGFFTANVRNNVLLTCNTSTQTIQVYNGDTSFAIGAPTLDAVMDWFVGTFSMFGTTAAGNRWNGDCEAFYFAPGEYLDISVEANRRLFFDASGIPTDLSGAPTAAVKFTGDAAAWNAGLNEGNGGNFTVVGGTITDA